MCKWYGVAITRNSFLFDFDIPNDTTASMTIGLQVQGLNNNRFEDAFCEMDMKIYLKSHLRINQ